MDGNIPVTPVNNALEQSQIPNTSLPNINWRFKPIEKTIPIEEIQNNPNYDPTDMLNKIRSQESYIPGKLSPEDELDLARALTKQEYDFALNNRQNMSVEADALLEKIKNGHELRPSENIQLLSSEEEYNRNKDSLANVDLIYDIQERTKNGTITMEDLNYLLSQIGTDEMTADMLKQNFINSGKVVDSYDTGMGK
jgi:hypothetical protein